MTDAARPTELTARAVVSGSPAGPTSRPIDSFGTGRLVDVLIAAVVVIPTVTALLAAGGVPADWTGWLAIAGQLAAGAAVLTCRRHLHLAAVLIAVAVLCVPYAETIYGTSGPPWLEFVPLLPLIALAYVLCALGAMLPLKQSVGWLVVTVAVAPWAIGYDATYLMIGIGWWVIGRVLRARQIVAMSLRARAADLAAERDRFTAEAVRLERTRMARELHDVVAHCMTVIVIQSRAGRALLGTDPAAAREAMEAIAAVAAEAEADVGALVRLIDPESTRPLTRELMDEMVSRAAGTGTSITAEITGDPGLLPPAVAVVAHRLVQEALTNAFRYAPGAYIRIRLCCNGTGLVEVVNDASAVGAVLESERTVGQQRSEPAGRPQGLVDVGSGRGLHGLRERAVAAGGDVEWGPTPDGGWRVAGRFPDVARP